MRVLVTGVGGELGARVAALLVADRHVEATLGIDGVPPARTVRRLEFKAIDPRDRRRTLAAMRAFEPTAIVHLGVYEPEARSSARLARERTSANTITVLGAAADLPGLDRIVVRSGIEVYGRSRGSVMVPDESVPPNPTTAFARSLLDVERLASAAGEAADVPVGVLRLAPIVGPRYPSPLARYLALPVVPVSALADPPFSVIHVDDAARCLVAALRRGIDDTVNVVAPGALTVWQAARLGRRIPIPLLGPEWRLVRRLADLGGSPIPDHVIEIVHRGRTADGSRVRETLGVSIDRETRAAVRDAAETVPLRVVDPSAGVTGGAATAGRESGDGEDRPAGGIGAVVDNLWRRARGDFSVDAFGCDTDVQDAIDRLLRTFVRVEVTGGRNLPKAGPALLVANRRFGVLEPAVVGRAVRQVTDRRMRFVGLPDVAPLNTALRRAGTAVNDPAEVGALLRAGHLVGLPLAWHARRPLLAGNVAPGDIAPAHDLGVPVLPVAVIGGELTGQWRVFVGPPVASPRSRGPLALAEIADGARDGVQALLDEASPPAWPWD